MNKKSNKEHTNFWCFVIYLWISPVIYHILNSSILYSVFPKTWTDAEFIAIPKIKNHECFSDYCPTSIFPFLPKVLERLIHTQLSSKLHSLHITEDIRSTMKNGELAILIHLDFSNAFNTVDFDVPICTLRSLNMSSTAIDWFHNNLCGRQQRISIKNTVYSWCCTIVGKK